MSMEGQRNKGCRLVRNSIIANAACLQTSLDISLSKPTPLLGWCTST